MSCIQCGSPFHEKWNCQATEKQIAAYAVTKSTAARKDVHTVGNRISGAAESGERKPSNALPGGPAGTQALPVDTNSQPAGPCPTDPPRSGAATRKDAEALAGKPKRGRPKVHEDRKAYLAQKARERRARKKAQGNP